MILTITFQGFEKADGLKPESWVYPFETPKRDLESLYYA